jgi:RNA polymerase sigma factor FliA
MLYASQKARYVVNGVEVSQEEIIHKYLPLIKYLARRYHCSSLRTVVEVNDLVQEGIIGLITALKKYDNSSGTKFETYAGFRISGAIVDAIRASDRAPRTVREDERRLKHAYRTLVTELGRFPTDEETAQRLGITLKQLHRQRVRANSASTVSLNEPARKRGLGRACSIEENLVADDGDVCSGLLQRELRSKLVDALKEMSAQQRAVIEGYYFRGVPLMKVAETLGVSLSRASQIHRTALGRLREYFKAHAAHVADEGSPLAA